MIMVTKSSMPSFDEYCEEIKKLWESHWLTNNGIESRLLEMTLKEYLKVKKISLFVNGHAALECAINAMNFPSGGEIITTPFTFVSTTHAIVRNNLVPVFCDINKDDYTIDALKIEDLITEKTCAIMPVHVYGNICDVERIEQIARKHNLKVIYDAAHAFGVRYKGKSIANFGDATMFSFHATKVFNTIEGGAICCSSEEFEKKLDKIKNFGIVEKEDVEFIGLNAKMNEFQAAMGVCNLKHFDRELKKRQECVFHYRKRLGNNCNLRICEEQKNVTSNYAYFPVVFEGEKSKRERVLQALEAKKIFARKYFFPLTNRMSCYKSLFDSDARKTPIANDISERVVCLPLYADLNITEIDLICDIILNTI